jgi:hypothetical protein
MVSGECTGVGRVNQRGQWRSLAVSLTALLFAALSCATRGKVSGQLLTTMALARSPQHSPHSSTLYGVLDYKVRKYLCEPMVRLGMSPNDLTFEIGKMVVSGTCTASDPAGATWATTRVIVQLYIDEPSTGDSRLLFESRGANAGAAVRISDLLGSGVAGVAFAEGADILAGILADCSRHEMLVFRVRMEFQDGREPPPYLDLQLDFPWGVDVDL